MTEPFTVRRVLITGAAGAIGSVLRDGFRGRYDVLRLSDVRPLSPARDGEEVCTADIQDLDATAASMKGIDCVVHMAALPVENEWEKILPINIAGTYNVFEAARRAGVKRVVYASSNHTVGFYRRSQTIDTDVEVRPDSRYGVSKVFGEAVGRLYVHKHGLSVACLRIGSFREKPEDLRQLATWISYPDTVHLVERCIDHPDYHFAVVYGVSNNDRNIWDNSKVEWLGYKPQDNAEKFVGEIAETADDRDKVAKLLHGGSFCSDEFTGDIDSID